MALEVVSFDVPREQFAITRESITSVLLTPANWRLRVSVMPRFGMLESGQGIKEDNSPSGRK